MEKVFRIFVEIIFGLQIAASPTAIGIILGLLIYIQFPNQAGMYVGLVIALIGLFIGIFWAIHVARSQGTANFISRIDAVPELDSKDQTHDENTNKG